jgi:hypothetical protein
MAGRRDYADTWRDTAATLAQVPVAGLLAADYFAQQWVERTAVFLMHVKTRFELARPADESEENLMAGALGDDLMDAVRTLTRSLVSLPGEAATYFNRKVEDGVREVLERVQPDAATDPSAYLRREVEKVARDVERLRQIGRTAATRRERKGERVPGPGGGDRDLEALEAIQQAVDRALEQIPRTKPRAARPEPLGPRADIAQYRQLTLALQTLLDEVNRLRFDRDDVSEGIARPRGRPYLGETQRSSPNRPPTRREDGNGEPG